MKKLFAMIVTTVMMLSLAACGSSTPEATVDQYFAAAQKLDVESMVATIAPSNTENVEETTDMLNGEDQDDYTQYFLDYLKANAEKMTYTITDSDVDGDTAIVTVECKYVDGAPIIEATMGEVFSRVLGMAFSGAEPTEEEMAEMFISIMQEQTENLDESFMEAILAINCIKQDGVWYIAEVDDIMLDVVLSGFIAAGEDIASSFGGF